jgi:hypothetical protein
MEGLELAVSKLIQLKDVSKSGIAVGDVLTVLTTNPYTFGWGAAGGGALGSDSFTTVAGTDVYTRPALNGKTIVLLFYGQTLADPSTYSLTGGDQLKFAYPPDDAYNIVIIYQ